MNNLVLRAKREKWLHAYLFIAPIIVVFGLFRIYPSVQTLVFSFFKVNVVTKEYVPIGLQNFERLLTDSTFIKSIVNTAIFAVSIVTVSTILGMVLAAMFNTNAKGSGVFRAIYFAPYITSTVAAAVVWGFLYDPKFGLFNYLLKMVGIPPQGWIADSKEALLSIVIFSIWKTIGYNIVIFIAGLQNIPDNYYEAATIDGAGPLTKFLKITMPLLASTTIFIVIYNTILALKVFDQVFVLTAGGPADASTVVVLQIYKQAFENYRFGYAAAMAFVLFVFLIVITVLQFTISRRWEVET
ncbi:MAG TPA: sugar ABC transporter permease [Spirochaetia bacterium]|nr:sugar ABC transporter permease [Spirochaetia bacterium]